jgi:hypothetical protein
MPPILYVVNFGYTSTHTDVEFAHASGDTSDMRHQARIMGDGFHCSCGVQARFRRVDGTRENILAAAKQHQDEAEQREAVRPDAATAAKLIDDFQTFINRVNEVTTTKTGEVMTARQEPPVPPDLLNRIRELVKPFSSRDFPVLHEFLRDPGGPQFRDVLSELGKLRRLCR